MNENVLSKKTADECDEDAQNVFSFQYQNGEIFFLFLSQSLNKYPEVSQ